MGCVKPSGALFGAAGFKSVKVLGALSGSCQPRKLGQLMQVGHPVGHSDVSGGLLALSLVSPKLEVEQSGASRPSVNPLEALLLSDSSH